MKNFKMVLFLMLMLVGACATANTNQSFVLDQDSSAEDYDPTLWVQNTGIDVVRVYQNGRRIASVYPGQGQCVRLRHAQSSYNELTFGFLAGSQRWPAAQADFRAGSGWVWNINSNLPNHSEFDIYPSERCEIGD